MTDRNPCSSSTIGNKNYSSWSMRPGCCSNRQASRLTEVRVRFDSFDAQSSSSAPSARHPHRQVPVLVDGDLVGGTRWPLPNTWPKPGLTGSCGQLTQKPRPRAQGAEMHSGFTAPAQPLPMNIEAHLPDTGAPDLARPARRAPTIAPGGDVGRTAAGARRAHAVWPVHRGRRLLCPVHARLHTYALPVAAPHRRL